MEPPRRSGTVYRKEIRALLNGVQKSNRADVEAFSKGHLNENNLYKPPELKPGGTKWFSARAAEKENVGGGFTPITSPRSLKTGLMMNTLKNFSLGTAGVALPYTARPRTKSSKGPFQVDRFVSISSQGSYSEMDDGILIEEMGNAETMVLNPRQKGWVYDEFDCGFYPQESARSLGKAISPRNMRQSFIPNHAMGVTKSDQYSNMKKFEAKVVQKADLYEQNSMSASKAVEELESKLQEALDHLQYNSYGPNFHRLQIYSDVFEDLIENSSTFRYILGIIKKEYDDYIASLLDQQPSRHKLLQDQVEQLTARGTSDLSTLKQEQHNLNMLEEEAWSALEENERLKRELEDERQAAEEDVNIEELDLGPGETVVPVDLADKIEDIRHHILEKLDKLNDLRSTLRNSFVPSTVVTHLEQCIKETEVEMQRYMSQKDFYEQSIGELERDLTQAIQEADTTDKDAKRIWKRVNATQNNELEEGDEEDEQKWEWYIS